jgi:hypothetical protein
MAGRHSMTPICDEGAGSVSKSKIYNDLRVTKVLAEQIDVHAHQQAFIKTTIPIQ